MKWIKQVKYTTNMRLTEAEIDKLIAEDKDVTIKDYAEIVAEIEAISESVKDAA